MGILRLLLALSVVANHFGAIGNTTFVGGQIAVQSFYIISGFYMSLILNEKYIGVNNSFKLFFTNRCMRLFPVYWFVLLLTIFCSAIVAMITNGQSSMSLHSYYTVSPNILSYIYLGVIHILIFGQDVAIFLGINPGSGAMFFTSDFRSLQAPMSSYLVIPQAWTLGIELTFYLVAPFILRKGYKFVIPIIFLSLFSRIITYSFLKLDHDPWIYRFFPNEIIFFLLGYLSYRFYLRIKLHSFNKAFNASIFAYIILATLLFSKVTFLGGNYLGFTLAELLYLLSVVLAIPFLFNFFKRNKFDTQVGELSYPLYISHVFVGMMCYGTHMSFFKGSWLIALLGILCSYLLNRFVSRPIETFRQARIVKQAST